MEWINEKENLIKYIQEDKLSYEEIGRKYNCSGSNIKKIAKKLGIELQSRRIINSNETFNKGKGAKYVCINCGKEYNRSPAQVGKFCSKECSAEYRYKQNIKLWKEGQISGTSCYNYAYFVKKYLFDKYNCKCQICGWGEINPFTGKIPLQVHHIDGDSCNNKEENLQLLCPNCHSLTDNFGSRNKNATEGRSIYYGKAKTD